MSLPILDEQPAVAKVIRGYSEAKDRLQQLEADLPKMEARAQEATESAKNAPVALACGDIDQAEADTLKEQSVDAHADLEQHRKDIEVQRQAVSILKERINEARHSTAKEIRATYEQTHAELFERMMEAARALEGAQDEILELERQAGKNGVHFRAVGDLKLLDPQSKLGDRFDVAGWEKRIRSGNRHLQLVEA